MTAVSAVCIHNNLAASQSCVAHRSANHESSRRVDVILRVLVQHRAGHNRLDHQIRYRRAQIVVRNAVAVLRRNHHRVHASGPPVAVFDRDLRLAVRPQEINFSGFSNFGEFLRQTVGQLNGKGHQFFGLIAGKAKHQALIARTAGIYAHGNVRRLAPHGAHHCASFAVVAVLRPVVAHAANRIAHKLIVINVRGCRNFSGHHRETCRHQRFARDAAFRVLLHYFI